MKKYEFCQFHYIRAMKNHIFFASLILFFSCGAETTSTEEELNTETEKEQEIPSAEIHNLMINNESISVDSVTSHWHPEFDSILCTNLHFNQNGDEAALQVSYNLIEGKRNYNLDSFPSNLQGGVNYYRTRSDIQEVYIQRTDFSDKTGWVEVYQPNADSWNIAFDCKLEDMTYSEDTTSIRATIIVYGEIEGVIAP